MIIIVGYSMFGMKVNILASSYAFSSPDDLNFFHGMEFEVIFGSNF